MSLREVVARNIQRARRRRGESQGQIARRAQVSVSYVSMLEAGRRSPPLPTLQAIAAALQIPVLDLLRGTPGADRGGHRAA